MLEDLGALIQLVTGLTLAEFASMMGFLLILLTFFGVRLFSRTTTQQVENQQGLIDLLKVQLTSVNVAIEKITASSAATQDLSKSIMALMASNNDSQREFMGAVEKSFTTWLTTISAGVLQRVEDHEGAAAGRSEQLLAAVVALDSVVNRIDLKVDRGLMDIKMAINHLAVNLPPTPAPTPAIMAVPEDLPLI